MRWLVLNSDLPHLQLKLSWIVLSLLSAVSKPVPFSPHREPLPFTKLCLPLSCLYLQKNLEGPCLFCQTFSGRHLTVFWLHLRVWDLPPGWCGCFYLRCHCPQLLKEDEDVGSPSQVCHGCSGLMGQRWGELDSHPKQVRAIPKSSSLIPSLSDSLMARIRENWKANHTFL